MRASTVIAYALIGLLAVLITCVAFLPVGTADWALERMTAGRLRLANTSGTVWNGQGRLVLADVTGITAEASAGSRSLQGLVIPGRLTWQVRPLPLLMGIVDATVTLDGMSQPLRLTGSFGELRVSGARLDLPSVDLGRLGSPWNTIRPSAGVGFQWDGFTIRQGLFEGRMSVELREAASAVSPVRPLGSYKVDVVSSGPKADVSLSTLQGPLRLTGNGNWTGRGGLSFTVQAESEPRERERLSGLLSLVGRREGERVIIKIGA